MTGSQPRVQSPDSQRNSPIQPPMSKFYHGPLPSGDPAPAQQSPRVNHIPSSNPPLPPRPSRTSPRPQSPWANTIAQTGENGQPWHLPGPPPTAPLASQVGNASYNPNTYGPMPGAMPPGVPAWNHSSQVNHEPDPVAWGVQFNQTSVPSSSPWSKPPLPPRLNNATHDDQSFSSHQNLYQLQPVAYSPNPSATTFGLSQPPSSSNLPPPPPPPPKLPPENQPQLQLNPQGAPQHPPFSFAPLTHNYDPVPDNGQGTGHLPHSPNQQMSIPPQKPQFQSTVPTAAETYLPSQNLPPPPPPLPSQYQLDLQYGVGGQPDQSIDCKAAFNLIPNSLQNQQQCIPTTQFINTVPEAGHTQQNTHNLQISTPQQSSHPQNGELIGPPQIDSSFYWHSPQSSSDLTPSQGQSDPEDGRMSDSGRTEVARPRTDDSLENGITHMANQGLSNTPVASSSFFYNASALGLGGPSDWEYFGDYAGEVIDDTELYGITKPKHKPDTSTENMELPASPSISKQRPESSQMSSDTKSHDTDSIAQADPEATISSSQDCLIQSSEISSNQNAGETTRPPETPLPSKTSYENSMPNDVTSSSSTPRQGSFDGIKQNVEPLKEDMNQFIRGISPEKSQSVIATGVSMTDPKLDAANGYPLSSQETARSSSVLGVESEKSVKEEAVVESHPTPAIQSSAETSGMQDPRSPRRSVFPKSVELNDPYANLDPWAKASLNRYVKMLREEAQTESEEEKYRVFITFVRRETRLRAVLYDVEDEPDLIEQNTTRSGHQKPDDRLPLRPSVSKALPALPPDAHEKALPQSQSNSTRMSPSLQNAQVRRSESDPSQERAPPKRLSTEESFVMIDSQSEGQYSPGGRPLISRLNKKGDGRGSIPNSGTPEIPHQEKPPVLSSQRNSDKSHSDGSDAPILIGLDTSLEPPRSTSVPPSATSGKPQLPSTQSPDRPAYVPFRYNEGRPYSGEQSSRHQSVRRPYSALRLGSLDSGLNSVKDSDNKRRSTLESSSSLQIGNDEASFHSRTGSIPDVLGAGPGADARARASMVALTQTSKAHGESSLNLLEKVLPQASIVQIRSGRFGELRQAMDAIVDDFSFIHKAVVAWDVKAKKVRERNDRDRSVRQVENEQRIDALFNENEIGYGDISQLEADFKRSEAAKKTTEDRAEDQAFISDVFDYVWTHLHYEMDQLAPLYDECTNMVHDASAGKDMFQDLENGVAIAPAMDVMLTLHQKLNIRHQKAFEAVLERDRRLKKTEVAPWYTLGNIAKVKQLEKQFEDAEKKAILDFCQKRDARANELMDIIDENTLRGVGANQDYMESIMQVVRKIVTEVAVGTLSPKDQESISQDEIIKAKSITTAVARSSEHIVQTFHVVDMLLNAADYEASVANAKLSGADPSTLQRLSAERAKEDQKLVKDLEHRLTLIRGDSIRTHDEIEKLLSLVGERTDEMGSTVSPAVATDASHQERLQKALEEAKARNASKEAEAAGL